MLHLTSYIILAADQIKIEARFLYQIVQDRSCQVHGGVMNDYVGATQNILTLWPFTYTSFIKAGAVQIGFIKLYCQERKKNCVYKKTNEYYIRVWMSAENK